MFVITVQWVLIVRSFQNTVDRISIFAEISLSNFNYANMLRGLSGVQWQQTQ